MNELTKKEVDRIIAEGSEEEFAELDRRFLSGESVLYQKQMPDYRSRIDKNIGKIQERERIIKLLEGFIDETPISSEEEHTIRAIEYLLPFIKGEQK